MQDAALHFKTKGNPEFCEPYGNGHINRTYLVVTDKNVKYILQQVNRLVFLDVPALMRNIGLVTRFLAQQEPDERRVLTIVKTLDDMDFYTDEADECWRMFLFITDSVCLDRPESPLDFYRSGLAFGRFQRQLAYFPAETLHETIARFHDTSSRYRQLLKAAQVDPQDRLKLVTPEMDFAVARADRAGYLTGLQAQGTLLTRVTHNDTKLNNVLLDRVTRDPLCVIDLDTVMPGLAAYDFGDSIRFGASTAAEDETDLSKVSLSLDLFRTFSEGFLRECNSSLNREEVRTLPDGAWMMTFECGLRFLTDFLSGDTYFRVHRPGHNLDRCRTQFRLAADMEKMRGEMDAIIEQTTNKMRLQPGLS